MIFNKIMYVLQIVITFKKYIHIFNLKTVFVNEMHILLIYHMIF